MMYSYNVQGRLFRNIVPVPLRIVSHDKYAPDQIAPTPQFLPTNHATIIVTV
jgi:hypothetical protein